MSVLEPRDHFPLNAIHRGLFDCAPPAGAHDPEGDWELTYRICTLSRRCEHVGDLGLKRRNQGKEFLLGVRYDKYMPQGYRQWIEAEIRCSKDRLPKPLAWTFLSEIRDPEGQPIEGTRTEHTQEDLQSVPSTPYTLNWILFECVPRLPKEPFEPIRFTLLDHFDQVKPDYRLGFRESLWTVLGGSRVQATQIEELEKGRVARKVWDMEGAVATPLTGYDLVGRGNVPWVFYVDEQGRLLYVVAGLESYMIECAEEG